MKNILICLAALCAVHAAVAASPTPVQMCTTTANSTDPAALMGCPRSNVVFGLPKNATDLLRVQTPASWVPYGSLTASMKLSSATSWNTPAALGIALLPTAPPTPSVPVPVPLNYTVTVNGANPPVGALFYQLDSTQPQCFQITNGVKSTQVCL